MPNGVSRFGKGIIEQELASMFETHMHEPAQMIAVRKSYRIN